MVFFSVFFTLGVWLLQQQSVLPDSTWLWLLPALSLSLLIPKDNGLQRSLRTIFFAALACGIGFYLAGWQAQLRMSHSLPDNWQGRDIEIIGVISELPHKHQLGLHFSFDLEKVITPQASVPPHIYLSTYNERNHHLPDMHAGERWQLTVRLKQPHGSSNPYGHDFELWAVENNIRAVGYVNSKLHYERLDQRAGGSGYHIEAWREMIREKLEDTLSNKPFTGVLIALAIGDQSSIPQSQWQVFTRTGVNHLMSISGLHITMLSGLGFAMIYWLWRRSARLTLLIPTKKAAALSGFLVALGYALLSGYGVPAQRTVYMLGAVTAALLLNRNFSLGQLLSIALIGVLIPDPWAVMAPGFWLSFGAVTLILYVSANRLDPLSNLHNENEGTISSPVYLTKILTEYGKVQWAMTIGLIPMLLALFQQVSLVSPIANAFAIPLVSLVVVPLTLLGAMIPAQFVIGSIPLNIAHQVMEWTIRLLEKLNDLPQAVWTQHAPPEWSIAAGMLGILVILSPRGFPARWLGFLMLLPMFANSPEPPKQESVRVFVFDVGQGLSVAVQTSNHALLYDAGPNFNGGSNSGNRILIPSLRAMGIEKLDGMILTHDDSDHTGGAASILQAIPVGWLSSSLPSAHPLMVATPEKRTCMDGQSWKWDGVDFEILHPDKASYSIENIRDNNRGCVLRISIGDKHILLATDIENESERRLLKEHPDKLPASLLVVPHHGSLTSSTEGFVATVKPEYAVITAGYRNRFGHPKEKVVKLYTEIGAKLYRSDEDGAVIAEMDVNGLQLESYRKTHRHYWTHIPHIQ